MNPKKSELSAPQVIPQGNEQALPHFKATA